MQPRYFFFGLYRVAMWEYFWGMTMAQIELMSADKPLTLYGKRSDFSVPDAEDLEECRRQYEARHADDGGKTDVKELMSHFK